MSEPNDPAAAVPGASAPAEAAAAGTGSEGIDPAEIQTVLARAEATAADNWNRYLRAVAELENLRKRTARDLDQARRSGIEKLAGELLPVVDSLEMGLESGATATAEALLAGKEATLRLLRGALERFAVETIDPLGEPFDPQLHEAMSMQPSATAEPGSVTVVLQKGYRLGERLLRPARVIVAGDPVSSGQTVTGDGEA